MNLQPRYSDLHTALYLKDKFAVSNTGSDFPNSNKLKRCVYDLNAKYEIKDAPENIVGVQQKLSASVQKINDMTSETDQGARTVADKSELSKRSPQRFNCSRPPMFDFIPNWFKTFIFKDKWCPYKPPYKRLEIQWSIISEWEMQDSI